MLKNLTICFMYLILFFPSLLDWFLLILNNFFVLFFFIVFLCTFSSLSFCILHGDCLTRRPHSPFAITLSQFMNFYQYLILLCIFANFCFCDKKEASHSTRGGKVLSITDKEARKSFE